MEKKLSKKPLKTGDIVALSQKTGDKKGDEKSRFFCCNTKNGRHKTGDTGRHAT
jgi:hypothetical protein